MYDTIMIGGGPAGLTAAMYTCRKKMKTLVITMDIGGQTNLAAHIENYPGVDTQHGHNLMKNIEKQAKKFGAKIRFGKVEKVKKENDNFIIEMSDNKKLKSKTVILAYGKMPRSLGIPGENEFLGRGVSKCITCDLPLYKNIVVAVLGGGNSAIEGALDLATVAKKVYLIHRNDKFKADEFSVDLAKKEKAIEIVLNTEVKEIKGNKKVDSLIVEDVKTKKKKILSLDGVFIEVGYVVDNSMVKDLLKVNDQNEIVVNNKCQTSCKGAFAAGDVTSIQFKQTIIAAGEGTKAALSAHSYLRGITGVSIDWLHYLEKK